MHGFYVRCSYFLVFVAFLHFVGVQTEGRNRHGFVPVLTFGALDRFDIKDCSSCLAGGVYSFPLPERELCFGMLPPSLKQESNSRSFKFD
jgi:hypothetical protein